LEKKNQKNAAMKNLFGLLGALILLSSTAVNAQKQTGKTKVSGGILGAANFTTMRVKNVNSNIAYKTGTGFAGGAWVNFALAKKWSLEPQLQYNVYNYVGNNNPAGQFDGKMGYLSLPVLAKYHASNNFAILFGPQVNYNLNVNNDAPSNFSKDEFTKVSGMVTAGIELFPNSLVSGYARYMYGLSDRKTEASRNANKGDIKFYDQGLQVGLKVRLFEKKAAAPAPVVLAAPPPPPAPKDTDGDGVIDDQDKCPTVAGLAKYQGCPVPDTDKDGVNDEQDKCPTVAGLAKYQGCPVPDTDKDGVNDEEDKCPTVAGLARYAGCPIPDTDGDGVNDEEDKCPNEAGVASNFGCPDMSKQLIDAARSFYFQTGTAKLANVARAKSKVGPLLELLKKYPNMHIDIEGHTDNTGTDKINNPLSQKRADAVKNYLVKQGIAADRLTSTGYGSTRPIADNKSKEGRGVNRRTVLIPKFVN
jgi:outer membrane protein OmpA-like peptidoglycan-associated protein